MTHTRIKLLVVGVTLAVAGILLAVAGARDGWVYFLQVDQFLAGDRYHDQRVRVHGTVGADNLEVNTGLLQATFDLLGETGRLRIEYGGVVPDLFQADRDVVVEGQLDEAGVFQADTLLTKCASKYESDEGQAPHANPRGPETTR